MNSNLWSYTESAGRLDDIDLTGYKVEATDGGIGKVARHSDTADASCLIVDTGPWIFGKEVLLPAGTVSRIDVDEQTIHVDRTKDQVKAAPEFHRETHYEDPAYYRMIAEYYAGYTHRA